MSNNAPTFLTSTHQVLPHECGPDGKVKLQGILDYFQDIAAAHADLLNVGLEDMLERQQIWVLSRLKIRISRLPSLGEKLTVMTYPSGLNKLFATRQYQILDEQGELLCGGSSYWLVVDPVKSRPVRPFKELAQYALLNQDKPFFYPEIDKIAEKTLSEEVICDYTVRHTHIDLNQHLNNAFYGSFTEDVVCALKNGHVPVREVQINFLQACPLHTKIICKGIVEENTSFYVEGRNKETGELCFQSSGLL